MRRGDLKNSAERKLRAAVIGVGYLGKFHVEKYAANSRVEIVGVCDTVLSRAKEWGERVGAQAYADHRDLLGKVDAVSVVVPTDRHHEVARAFLDSGVDVLLEKPIAANLSEADDLIAAARKKGRILQVGHLERFNPAFLAARDRIKIPLFIETHRLTPFRGRGTDVDVVLDLMIHDLDIILSLVRGSVEHIHAVGVPVLADKVDIANVRLQFQGGCEANLTASRISLQDQRRLRIFQPDSYVTIDYAAKKAGGDLKNR
jgi:predicted dehydrogenase